MEQTLAALQKYQINNFFSASNRPTQEQCNLHASKLTGFQPTATPIQGGSSYTVAVGSETVVQFRAENAPLDLSFLHHVEQAYEGFIPWHKTADKLGTLHVYTMRNVGGAAMYLARESVHADECRLLRRTLADFACFFASPWHNTPKTIALPARESLLAEYTSDLTQLSQGLPPRFLPLLRGLLGRLPSLLLGDWPLVPNHTDLLENNIHVDPVTGRLKGVVDWAGARVGPFGLSIGEVENLLGVGRTDFTHEYHANHEELREGFYRELCRRVWPGGDGVSMEDWRRLEDARWVGLFLTNGWRIGEDGRKAVAREGDASLCLLSCVFEVAGYKEVPLFFLDNDDAPGR